MKAETSAAMRSRAVTWPWLVLLGFVVIAVAAMVLVAVNGESLAEQMPFVVAFALFGVVGALIVSRARNRIGSLLLYAAAITATAFLSGEVMTYLVDRGTTSGALVVAAGVVSNVGWVVGILPVLFLLPLLFPDGHLPSRRWLPLSVVSIVSLALLAIAILLGDETLYGSTEAVKIENPLFLPALGTFELSDTVINVVLIAALGGNVLSLILRFRRARGVERQQIKWVAASLVFLLFSFIASGVATALGAPAIVARS